MRHLLLAGSLILAVGCSSTSSDGSNDPQSTLDQRTCEIARQIAGDYGVTDTPSRSQQRIADLYSGYGSAASPALAAALRDWSSGMTQGNLTLAGKGATETNAACTAEGF